ncbi:MAG: penicillin acylase family protein [Chitinophagales bacterium]|nr:penicillin acylase family protein [Chitinophagales bacterium]
MKNSLLCLAAMLLSLSLSAQRTSIITDPSKIDIVRDSFGVPHIFAKTDAEVAYGLAWATAEDDFETMQWGLLISKGMLGRHLGIEGAKLDYAAQLLRVRKTVEAQYDQVFSAHFKKVLEAYAEGANAYARTHQKEVLVKKSFPLTGKDIATGYALAMCLMSGVDGPINDIINGNIVKQIPSTPGIGSNAFAFRSTKTTDGQTYLAINSHQPLEGPLSWYEAHLCSEEGWNIVGGMFHGCVSIMHGTNENLGWAHTYNDFDVVDVFQLKMNPDNGKQYWFDGKWVDLEQSKARLVVKIFKKTKIKIPVKKKIWWSKYGATLKTDHGVFAVKLGANERIAPAEQWFQMNKAKNYTEFRKALDIQQLARMTVVYADRYDTIFAVSNGLVPKRNPNYDWWKVVPGDTSATLWNSYQPVSKLPQELNPDCGYVFNVNNSGIECTGTECNDPIANYDATMGFDLKKTNRSERFYELIDKYDKLSWNDFLAIKYDDVLPDSLVFINGLDLNELAQIDPTAYPDIADALLNIRTCEQKGDINNKKVSIFLMSFYRIYDHSGERNDWASNKQARMEMYVRSIREAKDTLTKYFGSIDIALGDWQRLQRGDIDLPVGGLPDVIKACYSQPWKDGKRRIWVGESYIQLVRFTPQGPIIESVSPYGASNKPGSKHSTDQMNLYLAEKRKPMSLDKATVYQQAEKVYHPQYEK